MNILLLGSGAREHALAWKMSESDSCQKIYVVPGNDGMHQTPKVQTVKGDPCDRKNILALVGNLNIEFVFVGPEKPLALGIVDALEKENIPVLGPNAFNAQLESSKVFSKNFMTEFSIPTAKFETYDSLAAAKKSLDRWDITQGVVIKADALAAGKGVVVTHDRTVAEKTLFDFMENPACTVKTKHIIIEEKLKGRELSAFAICDGEYCIPFGYVCDYKRAYDDDKGPNTGGMGGHTPNNWPSQNCKDFINNTIFKTVIEGMKKKGRGFKGILFAGLMIDEDEKVHVIEFNVRLGDPEAQVLLPLIEGDIVPIFDAAAKGKLSGFNAIDKIIRIKNQFSHHVVMASKGYPSITKEPMDIGKEIDLRGLSEFNKNDFQLFFAAVRKNSGQQLVTNGGRVLGVTTTGETLETAKKKTYEIISKIKFEGAHFRNDIGR